MATFTNLNRLGGALAGAAAALLLVLALPASARAADYDTTLTQLDELQTLAETYVQEQNTGADPVLLTLAYTRGGSYNDSLWQLTAGAKDGDFETYVRQENADLAELVGLGTLTTAGGESVDFGHLLASINLVYNGLPITGSWGGDCMELARYYQGQASDAEGYAQLMTASFNLEDDGSGSVFGAPDLRADLDSVNIGTQLSADSRLADVIRSYYQDLTEYDRCYQFIARTFGTVNTGEDSFRDRVYETMTGDTGMQLLLYTADMWSAADGWAVSADAEPALQGAAYVFADYLSGAVNGERVKNDEAVGLTGMARSALAEALSALGDSDAASAALAAGDEAAAAGSDSAASTVDSALDGATQTLRSNFDATIFQLVLLIIGAVALFGLILSVVMLVREIRRTR